MISCEEYYHFNYFLTLRCPMIQPYNKVKIINCAITTRRNIANG